MKQYVVDELRPADVEKIRNHLDERFGPPDLTSIYWVPIDPQRLSEVQAAHGECRPHVVAFELGPDRIVCELLVRTRNRVRCNCMAYAEGPQRDWVMAVVDDMLAQLAIKV